MTSHLSNERMVNDSNVFDEATIPQSGRNNLVVHAGLWLYKEELALVFRQRGDTHLKTEPIWESAR